MPLLLGPISILSSSLYRVSFLTCRRTRNGEQWGQLVSIVSYWKRPP